MHPLLRVKKLHHTVSSLLLKAIPAAKRYGYPGKKLQVYGITGTDGKTTSSTMLYHLLKTAGWRVALISTVAAFIDDEEIDTGFHVTSPEPWQVQKLLAECVKRGIEHVVLETTSHGYFQFRTYGIPFTLTGLTNITPEHLDYFMTYDDYLQTKAEFLAQSQHAFINANDRSFPAVKSYLQKKGTPFTTYRAELDGTEVDDAIEERFAESYNRANAQLVRAMADHLGVDEQAQAEAFRTFSGVRGRMEQIPNRRGIKIVVDFAHTPNALENALEALRPQTEGRLIAVFGCAGLRDPRKRPAMGGIASRLADFSIFTAEDPRTEDIQVIFRQMKEGVEGANHRKIITVPDRGEAIRMALEYAKRGDTIGIFGKGHERSMCYGKVETPWSDQEAVKALLATP